MAHRATSLSDGELSHTLGLIVLAAGMGAMLVAVADSIARAIQVAELQALDLGACLPLPWAGIPAAGQRLALTTAVATCLSDWQRS
jgi:hypothetical protein